MWEFSNNWYSEFPSNQKFCFSFLKIFFVLSLEVQFQSATKTSCFKDLPTEQPAKLFCQQAIMTGLLQVNSHQNLPLHHKTAMVSRKRYSYQEQRCCHHQLRNSRVYFVSAVSGIVHAMSCSLVFRHSQNCSITVRQMHGHCYADMTEVSNSQTFWN